MTDVTAPGNGDWAAPNTPKHKVKSRFVIRDTRRAEGKTVEVDDVKLSEQGVIRYLIRTETHPLNPSAVGERRWITERTLDRTYRKISHN